MLVRILYALASLKITVIGLIFLLILTVWGTLHQAENGLFLAQERFYQSWVFFAAGVLPFPGAQTIMLVLFINLMAAIILLGLRGRLQWGMLITHVGLLLMLAAGGVTFYFGRESQLSLEEGEASNVALSFREWELALIEPSSGHTHHRRVHALNASTLRPGRVVPLPGKELSIRIEEYHRNSEPLTESGTNAPLSASGFTRLEPRPIDKEPSRNIPGLVVTLIRDGQEEKRYLLWGNDPNAAVIRQEAGDYLLGLRRRRQPLPALIELIDFRREMHPGSSIAKSYASQVLVRTGEEDQRRVLISMNKPLRLNGFTFYQSSFASSPGGREISTFSVVLNHGRTMPYIATGLTVVGMILHFAGMLVHRIRHRPPGGAP